MLECLAGQDHGQDDGFVVKEMPLVDKFNEGMLDAMKQAHGYTAGMDGAEVLLEFTPFRS